MSKTEELALSRLGTIPAGEPPKPVADAVVRDIVADGRRSEMHWLVPPVPVSLPDAERVVTAGAGAGWTNCPKVNDWKPPGLAIMDQLMDHQDALDRRERERKLRGR
jgi:hypothetical protein